MLPLTACLDHGALPCSSKQGRLTPAKIMQKAKGKEICPGGTPAGQCLWPWQKDFKRTPCCFSSLKGSSSQPSFSQEPCGAAGFNKGGQREEATLGWVSLSTVPAGPGLLCGLFIYFCGWDFFFFSCTIISRPLCLLWLSACSCRPSTKEIINTILAIIVANSTAGGSRLIPLMAFLLSPPPIILAM